ncbi:aminodeoxychorismate synthase, component I [Haloferacaceae archaeon DSL9]
MRTPTVTTDRSTFRRLAEDAPPGARVPVEIAHSTPDPFDAYRRARDGPGGVFLETTGGQSGWGYFAIDPVERLRVSSDAVVAAAVDSANPAAAVDPADPAAASSECATDRRRSPSLAAVEGLLSGERLVRGDCEVPYPCGAFGWLSYDIARELESLPGSAVDDRGLPRVQLAVFDRVAAWREPRSGEETALHVTVCPRLGADADADDAYDAAIERGMELIAAVDDGDPSVGAPPVAADEARFESDCGRDAFADRVRRVKRYIRDGDTFQTNISQRLVAPAAVHPIEAYDALRRVNPAPYSGLLEFSDRTADGWSGVDLVSASPELLLDRVDDRVETEPIAGTRPRGATAAEDAALEAELTSDEKERAEHAMLVDLERNDLGKVSRFGTVEVTDYRRVDRYSAVMHLVSAVEGELRPDATLEDAVAAVFPGGTITGAPKPRTMEIIDELETTRRGPYTGSVAAFGFDGRATLNIIIRTLVRHADEYHLRVGAGIVHDSDPEAEYDETLAKGRALVHAIDEALAAGRMSVEEAPR